MRTSRLSFAVLLTVGLLAAVSAIWFYNLIVTKLVLTNCSSFAWEAGEVVVAGATVWKGKLSPQETVRVRFFPQTDSSFQITGKWKEKDFAESFGYTTGYDGSTHVLTLTPFGEFDYDMGPGASCRG